MLRFLLVPLLAFIGVAPCHAAGTLPPQSPKYQAVKRVYDRVARAFGDARLPPQLLVAPEGETDGMKVAWADPGAGDVGVTGTLGETEAGYIAIEEKVYDLFSRSAGDPEGALAFVLGHELAHYYLRHGWAGDFGNSFASLDVGRKMLKAASYDEVVRRETEADYFGGFNAYLAGYDALGAAPQALDLLYAHYRLPDKIPSYPARAERKAIAERAGTNLQKMVPVFEGANLLLLLERRAAAGRLYGYLARAFPSREMFNNAGVAYALEALALFRPGSAGYAYPFEFDAQTRLSGSGGKAKGIDRDAERRSRLLNAAADAFEKALQRDRQYAVAKVNLAAVNSLLGDHDTAVLLANQALELARQKGEELTLSGALVARGIAYAAGGNRERALVDFAAARNSGNPHATLNLALLTEEKSVSPEQAAVAAAGGGEETINGISWRAPFAKGDGAATFSLAGSDEPPLTLYFRPGAGGTRTLALLGGEMLSAVATPKGYGGESGRGIRVGASLAAVRERYGSESRVVPARQATWHVYRASGIAFAFDPGGLVEGWMIFGSR